MVDRFCLCVYRPRPGRGSQQNMSAASADSLTMWQNLRTVCVSEKTLFGSQAHSVMVFQYGSNLKSRL